MANKRQREQAAIIRDKIAAQVSVESGGSKVRSVCMTVSRWEFMMNLLNEIAVKEGK